MKSIIIFKPVLLYLFAAQRNNNNNNKIRQQNIKGRNIWYIDGYNVLGHTGTTNNVTSLTNKLLQIESRTNIVVLVLDGPKVKSKNAVTTTLDINTMNATTEITSNELLKTTVTTSETTTIEMLGPSFRKVVLGNDLLADDYIIHDIQSMQQTSSSSVSSVSEQEQLTINNNNNRNIVQVVTADRKLRNDIMNIKPNKVRGIIHPVTFWKRYLPRLCGMKKKTKKEES